MSADSTGSVATDTKDETSAAPAVSAFAGHLHHDRSVQDDNLSDELFAAVRRGDVQRVKELLDEGADANEPEPNGMTVLMVAVAENQNAVAQELIARKELNLDAQDDLGMTALMLAAAGNNITVAKLLLNAMAGDDLLNADNDSADDVARARGNFALANMIVQRQNQRKAREEETLKQEEAGIRREGEYLLHAVEAAKPEPEVVNEAISATVLQRVSKFLGFSKFMQPPANDSAAEPAAAPAPKPNMVMNLLRRFTPHM